MKFHEGFVTVEGDQREAKRGERRSDRRTSLLPPSSCKQMLREGQIKVKKERGRTSLVKRLDKNLRVF